MNKHQTADFLSHQTVVDSGDPFLVEYLQTKTKNELSDIFERIHREYEVTMRGENDSAKVYAKERLMIVTSFIELKRLYEELEKSKKEEKDSTNGISIA